MQRISYRLYILILIFCPLAFTTVEPWSISIVQFLIMTSFLFLFVDRYRKRQPFYIIPGALPLTLFICWIAFQMLPIPLFFLQLLSPATYEIYNPLTSVDNSLGWFPITLHPKATLLSFLKWSTLAFFYVLTIYHLKNAKQLKQVITIIVILSSTLSIIALLQKLTSPDKIFWFRPAPFESSPMGPWVYSNQFAGFMEMIFPLIIAMFLYYRPQVHYGKNLKDRMLALITMPGANRYLLLGSSAILIAVSILLSLSRGGIITLCIAFLFFTVLWAKVTRSKHIQWGIILSACVILMITWFGWQPIMNEFGNLWDGSGLNLDSRLPIFQDTQAIIEAFPLVGTGMGTFQNVYPAFRSIPGELVFDHAHNDYLELLSEGGVVGFVLCAWFLFAVINSVITTLSKRRETYSILITCGIITGIFALLLHCLIDFQLANGANALYFFLFIGLAVSGANTRVQYRTRSTLLSSQKSPIKPYIIIAALVLILSSTWYNLASQRAEATVTSLKPVYLNPYLPKERLREIHDLFSSASNLDPLDAEYHLRMGSVSTLLNKREQANEEYLKASLLNPISGYLIQQLALSLQGNGSSSQEKLLKLGIQREPLVHERYLTYSSWLLDNGRKEDSIDMLRLALINIPEKAFNIAQHITRNQFQEHEVERILPNRAYAWYALARINESLHKFKEAEQYYMRAIDFIDFGEIHPDYFRRPYNLFLRIKEPEKALNILRIAIEYLPDATWFRIRLGDHYMKEGITFRAREEYLQGLRLEPGNSELQKRLKAISETLIQ